jgi:hypothetical protein
MTDELPVIPRMGTPKMHMKERSRVIGWMPKPETRGTEWRQPDHFTARTLPCLW